MTQPNRSFGVLSLASDMSTPWFGVSELTRVSFQITWHGLSSADSILLIEGSLDQEHYNEISSAESGTQCVLDTDDETQIFIVREISTNFLRVSYKANTNTTGSATVTFQGYL